MLVRTESFRGAGDQPGGGGGGGTPQAVGSPETAQFGSSTTLDVPMPATVNAGEFLLAGMWCGDNADWNDVTPPSGWQQADVTFCNNGKRPPADTATVNGALWGKPNADGSEGGTTVSFDRSTGGSPNASAVQRFSGVHATTPFATHTGGEEYLENNSGATNVLTIDSPSFTTPVDNCLVLIGVLIDNNAGTITPPGGATEVWTHVTASGDTLALYSFEQATAGATGAKTWNWDTNQRRAVAITLALRPTT